MIKNEQYGAGRKLSLTGGFVPAIVILMTVLLFSQCIVPWESGVEEERELISFDARLVKGNDMQRIVISRSTSLSDPKYLPLRNCSVVIQDGLQNEYLFSETSDGVYEASIADEDLVVGREYRLRVETADGVIYESGFERLTAPVPVDSLYFEVEDEVDALTGNELNGLQFFIDVEAPDTVSRYFRWILDETWEYTVGTPISWIYDIEFGELISIIPENEFELYRCYMKSNISDIFLTNTRNLSANSKKKVDLHYVSTSTDKLRIRYSLFVEQYTMNEAAFTYWDQNRISLQESGGLYNTQPGQPITNITNVNDSTEQVLGYFWVSSMTTRRLTFSKPKGLAVVDEFCDLVEFDYVMHIIDGTLPVYIYFDQGTGIQYTGPYACFDCKSRGGSLIKPDYWDD